MRRLLGLLGTLAILGGVTVAGTIPAGASTALVVEPGHSIQAVIDKVGPHGTVIVRPGVYRENLSIKSDGVSLFGRGAVLLPPAKAAPDLCDNPSTPGSVTGICIGNFTFGDQGPVVTTPLKDVTVNGLTIKNFTAEGIYAIGTSGIQLLNINASNDGDYGVFVNTASHSLIKDGIFRNNATAGVYVGDSPEADATVFGNESSGNQFGIFVRNAEHGTIEANRLHDNCLGVLFLADAPGPDGAFGVNGNLIAHNDKACAGGGDDHTPPLSGIGVLILGAHDVSVTSNLIVGNQPSGATLASGGVVVVNGGPATPGSPPPTLPKDNVVKHNVLSLNQPDILWDGSGSGNILQPNLCHTSSPAGLCS